jgi:mannose-6-phosphate isomerase
LRPATWCTELIQPAGFGDSVPPPAADAYFRLERRAVDGPVTIAPGFAIPVVTDGDLSPDDGGFDLPRGTTAVLPHASGPLALGGSGEAPVCRPPSPSAR